MLEKYFIFGIFAALLLLIALLFGSIVICWRLRHLKKLALLNILKRQQLMNGRRYFSTYIINSAINSFIFKRLYRGTRADLSKIETPPKKTFSPI